MQFRLGFANLRTQFRFLFVKALGPMLPGQFGEAFALKPKASVSAGKPPSQDVELDPAHGLDQEFQALHRHEVARRVNGHAAVREGGLITDENLRSAGT